MKIQFEFEATQANLTALRAFVDALGISASDAPASVTTAPDPKPARKKADTTVSTPAVQAQAQPEATELPKAEKPTQGAEYSLESVRALTREVSARVSKEAVVSVLKSLGAESVSTLKPELYPDFVASLKELA